jgi:hypothetical protein
MSHEFPPHRPSVRRFVATTVMLAVVVIVLFAGILYVLGFLTPPPTPGPQSIPTGGQPSLTVTITSATMHPTGAPNCWTSPTIGPGHIVDGGAPLTTTWKYSYSAGSAEPSSCTIQSVTVQSAGFTLVSANTPLVVENNGTQTLTVTVKVPGFPFTGALSLGLSDTSP